VSDAFVVQARCGEARAGLLQTKHGPVETPVFMPVGTQATVKSLAQGDLETLGAQIVLANTYHLAMRPGAGLVRDLGGLHAFMAWPRAILNRFGAAIRCSARRKRRKIDEDGVTFHSHVDGSLQRLTPESAMAIQADLGRDIAMAFDECPASDAPRDDLCRAMERTTRWARRLRGHPRLRRGNLRFRFHRARGH